MQILANSVTNFGPSWRSLEWYANQVKKAKELDGIQWEMQGVAISSVQIALGSASDDALDMIKSVKQGSRSERFPWTGLLDKNQQNKLMAFVAWFAFPHKMETLKSLYDLQILCARDLPIIVYPDSMGNSAKLFRTRMVQPTAQNMKDLGLKTVDDIVIWLNRNGLRAALDLYHMRRDGGVLADWRRSLPILLPIADEVHVSLGREKMGTNLVRSGMDLAAMRSNLPTGEVATMLSYIQNDCGWRRTFVLKIPFWNFQSTKEAMDIHNKVAENVRKLGR